MIVLNFLKRVLLYVSIISFVATKFSVITVIGAVDNKEQIQISSEAFVLMEANTGEVVCEKNKDKELMIASVTKIMTLLLIFENLEKGNVKPDETITVSKHAASMGGSQVFLEEGEEQTVNELIKCISISSANDACVAMAERIAGDEECFVKMMNEKAKDLGMKHSQFKNCCGLDDGLSVKEHFSSAMDVAIMSRELLTKYPKVSEYATTWMDKIVHVTKKGEKDFGLTNTNKLVRSYKGITGLKTGSTSKAKYCLSASAKRNHLEFIAVVLGAKTPMDRFSGAQKMLDYGFANFNMFLDNNKNMKDAYLPVSKGKIKKVSVKADGTFEYLLSNGIKESEIKKQIKCGKKITAPIKKGETLGEIEYYLKDKKIGSVNIVAKHKVEKAKYLDCVKEMIKKFV